MGILFIAISSKGQDMGKPHLDRSGHKKQLIVNGEPMLLLAGELGNSASSSASFMKQSFERCRELGLNTVIANINWDQFEKTEGIFDYTLIDTMISLAEEHELKLVVLWFASYKNGTMTYAPQWVKKDQERFPRVLSAPGERISERNIPVPGMDKDSFQRQTNILSPVFEETRKADARAFTALMRRIREMDHKETVVMVQVENEAGTYSVALDHQPEALKLYRGEVPGTLMKYLNDNRGELTQVLEEAWEAQGYGMNGSWDEVFGELAVDVFMAWQVASFMEEVTAAGKAVYDIPMYYNAWIKKQGDKPGSYPTGGPIHTMLDIYRAASPSIDFLSPDIYHPAFKQYVAAYDRPGNVLFVPECRSDQNAVAKAYWTIAEKNGIGFSPFAIEQVADDFSCIDGYRALQQLAPMILDAQGTERLRGLYRQMPQNNKRISYGEWDFDTGELEEEEGTKSELVFGRWKFNVYFHAALEGIPAYGLVLQLSEDEFLITGKNIRFTFSTDDRSKQVDFVYLQQGEFTDGKWVVRRQLNGDESSHGSRLSLPVSGDTFADNNRQDIVRLKLYTLPGLLEMK